MKRVIIVQARMTSIRFPGKVLMDLAGMPMLSQQISRLKHCRHVDEIVIATTINGADDPVIDLAEAEGVRWFRGSENDVLSRYVGAARESKADVIVRITADCPLIDPEQTDRVIQELKHHSSDYDYASNIVERTFPRGLDTEAFFLDTLLRVERMAKSAPAREHVTYFIIREYPQLFSIHSITDGQDNSDLRWTVDTPSDLDMVRRLYDGIGKGEPLVDYYDILKYARRHPDIVEINEDVQQKYV